MSRTLVLGDIHGAHRALVQVFERAKLDHENDTVVFVGDVCDGWPETKECIDELLRLKNLVFILGNHDEWMLQWLHTGMVLPEWRDQGGRATLESYGASLEGWRADPVAVPERHVRLLELAKNYHQIGNAVFVHGGIPHTDIYTEREIATISGDGLRWDRSLWSKALDRDLNAKRSGKEYGNPLTHYDEVYIGHTTTEGFSSEPVRACEVWNVDQGSGWGGRLSLMDVNTKEFWQADRSVDLYPEHKGRRG